MGECSQLFAYLELLVIEFGNVLNFGKMARPEVICRGVERFQPFLTWFPFRLASLPLHALVWSALTHCTLPTHCYMYKDLVVMFSCISANTNVPTVSASVLSASTVVTRYTYTEWLPSLEYGWVN